MKARRRGAASRKTATRRPRGTRKVPLDKPSLDPLFRPRSVAVVGASRKATSIGREVLANIVSGGFVGPVYPVNPHARVVNSMKAYPRVSAIPDPVDLAILAIPADRILDAVDDCGRKGVKALVVITAGFREIGGKGAELEAKLVAKVRRYGMRMVGPNCMGLMNSAPDVRLNASFSRAKPVAGNAGFVTQSGALGEVILADARGINLGLARFVSIGNKADVSGNDLLLHWENDPDVRLILMYLESFGNPRHFTQIARRISRKKPIVAVKAGRTAAGRRAAFSHTGALGGLDVAVDTLFEQCGVLRARSMEELFTLASAFATQPVPRGNRVAILSNAGGPGILGTDACIAAGLDLVELGKGTVKRLKKALPPECSIQNPVDLIASGGHERYEAALDALVRDRGIDMFLVMFVSPVMINSLEVARRIVAAAERTDKPLVTCFMGKHSAEEAVELLRAHGIPVYPFPESAAQALGAMNHYRQILERPEPKEEKLKVDRPAAQRILRRVEHDGRVQLAPEEAESLLTAYGIGFAPSVYTGSRVEAIDAAMSLGYPVVLKATAPGLVHKSDVGGVVTDLRNADEVGKAYDGIVRSVGKLVGLRVQVQAMVRGGQEVILGTFQDPRFGPLLMFGLGGIFVEYLKDVTFGLHPLDRHAAGRMFESIRGRPLLEGARGAAPVDREFLVEALMRLSQLVGDFPQIDQIDINPFLAGPDPAGSLAVDARVKLRSEPA